MTIGTVTKGRPGKHRIIVEFSPTEAEMLAKAIYELSAPGYRPTISGLIREAVRHFVLPFCGDVVITTGVDAIHADSALLPGREHESQKKGGFEQASASERERPA